MSTSKTRDGNHLISANLTFRAFFFCVKRSSGGNVFAQQINSVRHKKALGKRLG